MREWRRCDRCGYTKFGPCSMCFPAAAEAALREELAEERIRQADEERRSAGMLYCDVHQVHDGCIRKRSPAEIRAVLQPVLERRPMSWQAAMDQLRRRYVPPG